MHNGLRRTLGLVLPLLFLGTPSLDGQTRTYGLEPGDQIDLKFFTASGTEVDEISGSRWVDRAGQIHLPYIGGITVISLDAAALRERLVDSYQAFYSNPVVDVTVKLRVNVTGTVRAPGHFFVEPAATLVDVLAMAGGPYSELDFSAGLGAADQSRVHLVRDGALEVIDFRPDEADLSVVSRLVQSGDWLYVPPRTRSRWRDNIQFTSAIVTLAAGVIGIGSVLNWW